MKRFFSFSLAIFVFLLSVFVYAPVGVFADDDRTVLTHKKSDRFSMSSSDAQKIVSAHKSIYSSDGYLLFDYTPRNSYNWTMEGKFHLSDSQLENYLKSDKFFDELVVLYRAILSNNPVNRSLLVALGVACNASADTSEKFVDILTNNYNYLNDFDVDQDTQTITINNDNGSVDALRKELKEYYYDSIGLKFFKPVGTVKDCVNSSEFRKLFEFEEDYTNAYGNVNSKYAFFSVGNCVYFSNSDFADYYYLGNLDKDKENSFTDWTTSVYTYKLYSLDSSGTSKAFEINNSSYSIYYDYNWDSSNIYTPDPSYLVPVWACPYYGQLVFHCDMRYESATTDYWRYKNLKVNYYSADGSSFKYFSSYSALYNYLHGDQNAYLSSKIEETGQDISMKLDDIDDTFGSKLDDLIDTINSKKEGMSADELQDAIDKGIESLQKTTEDIKDNTSDIIDVLKEQNNILLQILGVTEYIAYQTTKDDGSNYTIDDLKNVFNQMYNGLGNAILYGKNTVTGSGSSSGNVQKASFSVSGASNNVAVAAYSLDDDVGADEAAAQDINNMDIHDGLFGKFPFSVPYQLYEWLQVLQADPVAPKLVYNYGFLLGHKDDQKYDLVIDFSIYEPWANVCKSFLRLSFTLLIAVFVFHKFNSGNKGGLL